MIHLTILHCNDVYEITPVSGGRLGGLARVATLCKELRKRNPNTIVTFGGDLYNPSGLGTALINGERLDGKQTVAVMNKIGVDYMTFGDHELNTVSPAQFAERLAMARYKVVSSNIFDADGQPFAADGVTVLPHDTFTLYSPGGESLRVGIFGLTKPVRLAQVEFIYQDWLEAAQQQVAKLRNQVDLLIALTHQSVATDRQLVSRFPDIDLVLGGDDHQATKAVVSPELAPIYKADSNARAVYVLDLFYDKQRGDLQIFDQLQPITDAIADDPETLAETQYWVDLAFCSFRSQGWEPTEVVGQAVINLDGFEATIRCQPTAFTHLITEGMRQAAQAELAILCSWAVRLDDCLPAGSLITRYDLLRTFSYGNSPVYQVAVPGDFLVEILNFGWAKAGSGSYLLTSPNVNARPGDGQAITWWINDQPLNPQRTYQVAMADDLRLDYLFYINAARAHEAKTCGVYGKIDQALIDMLKVVTHKEVL